MTFRPFFWVSTIPMNRSLARCWLTAVRDALVAVVSSVTSAGPWLRSQSRCRREGLAGGLEPGAVGVLRVIETGGRGGGYRCHDRRFCYVAGEVVTVDPLRVHNRDAVTAASVAMPVNVAAAVN